MRIDIDGVDRALEGTDTVQPAITIGLLGTDYRDRAGVQQTYETVRIHGMRGAPFAASRIAFVSPVVNGFEVFALREPAGTIFF
jgi:hypothetical protein